MIDKRYFGFTAPDGLSLDEGLTCLADFLVQFDDVNLRPIMVYVALCECPEGEGELRNMREALSAMLAERLGEDKEPAVCMAVQPPLDHPAAVLCAEIWCVDEQTVKETNATVQSVAYNNACHVVITSDTCKELWTSGFSCDYSTNAFSASTFCFEKLFETLANFGFTWDDLFRQWNYIGHIVDFTDNNGQPQQNYQAFNEARAYWYEGKADKTQYPAATGIGMDYDGVCISAVAVKDFDSRVVNVPMRSPVQKDAFSYAQKVLVGDKTDKKAPLFERGRCHAMSAMISGTASIRGEETIDAGDAVMQLQNTIDFINELVEDQTPELAGHYRRVRLYVKPGYMGGLLQDILEKSYPEPCMLTIVEADICRPDLLIEIEADLQL